MPTNSKAPRPIGLPALDINQRYDIREVGAYLRCCRCSVYKLFREKKLRFKKMGARTYVQGRELIRYLQA